MLQSTPDYSADIDAALTTQGGHLSIGRGGFTLHYRNGAMLSGYGCKAIKAQCIAAGLPVIDSRCVAFDVVVYLTLQGPLVAVGREPEPAPWQGLSYAPLHVVAARYAAAGAEVSNIPGVETMPTPANRRPAP
ncbi:hypothetical protein [Aminobacter sp. MDW-2]|uniref:hypothetical protein n=1 Tax=Aminobacter sp. MDW-2 TaxID=2666139 RepID=UPI0012AFF6A2|nr:hypothetical protein [Aminobacter sp. MDW-2]MRX36920.1 hypothetical protein [Aminobacter sp. MDW-2]QNH37943.1 hypothetical protein H5P29_31375 [Aminobacter sp. MDW-2]